jgi:hypothetical protein
VDDEQKFSMAAGAPSQSYSSPSSSDPIARVDSDSFTPVAAAPVLCDICGSPMIERNCKIICMNCGFRRDCTDP